MSTIIHNNLPKYRLSLYTMLDNAFRESAEDAIKDAKEKAPFKKGPLRSESDIKQIGALHWRISFYVEYALIQEIVQHKNYTTAGTGPHYLENAGDKQVLKLKAIVKKHTALARA